MQTYTQEQIKQMIETKLQNKITNTSITKYEPHGRLERVLHKISNLLGL